eukprot:CAMPEP_0113451670 /NCGR_PEP_ID=MMETSP0014_2-20120614/6456_1 /TAXON_ID=2857 /ORGANISM="Nitzschia sp." /LENGTH=450 /DNA_ID=CAMNT_0000343029 /DNA_START=383 /DNA_END=1732 /DNA_ORIENTATION=- /assembly_acc=CAM_ASM_000159
MVMMTTTMNASSSGIVFVRSMTSTASAVGSKTNSRRVAVVGGGLAGLSVAHHLIEKSSRQKDGHNDPIKELDITIFDRCAGPGLGGASAVAGGLLHPLSPHGKLVHLGLEGLASSSRLIDAASKFNSQTILRDKLYRIATDSKQVETLERTARELPDIAKWCEPSTLKSLVTIDSGVGHDVPGYDEEDVLGALVLQSGCKVIHVPSYLGGLWRSCQSNIKGGEAKWHHVQEINDSDNSIEWAEQVEDFDCVIFAAGSGLFQSNPIIDEKMLPIQLVRGQSIEMTTRTSTLNDALLSGKYISPLPGKNRVLVGATHEFKPDALKADDVKQELKDRSYSFASFLWDGCGDEENVKGVSADQPSSTTIVDRITSGYRVQSNRGNHGRQPIIGRIETPYHSNSWIFTGLSSRGLLYHGIYGDMLSEMILSSFGSLDGRTVPNDDDLIERYELDW